MRGLDRKLSVCYAKFVRFFDSLKGGFHIRPFFMLLSGCGQLLVLSGEVSLLDVRSSGRSVILLQMVHCWLSSSIGS